MKNITNFVKRNATWFLVGFLTLLLFHPGMPEIKLLLLIITVECLAMALSGLAVWAYTKIDFIEDGCTQALGIIFLAVHICTGLSVLGIYIAQFTG